MLSKYTSLKKAVFLMATQPKNEKGVSENKLKSLLKKVTHFNQRGNFSYVCTRVKARKTKLFPKEEYSRLLVMDLPDISRTLQERKYNITSSDFSSIEKGLQQGLEETLKTILDFSKGSVRTMVAQYMKRYDVYNIKTLLRGRISSSTHDDISEALTIEAGVKKELLLEAAKEETFSGMLEVLKKTEYYEILKKYLDEDTKNLMEVENALDRYYYSNLMEMADSKTKSNKIFQDFLRKEIDIINIDTLLKLRAEDVEVKDGMFVDGGKVLNLRELVNLSSSTYDNILTELKRYSIPLGQDAAQTMRLMERQLIKDAEKFSRIYPLSILPIIHYILAKEVEVENLRILAGSKESGLGRQKIEEMMRAM